jgi:predicted transposase/invertase (TIGR01784 family)
LKDTAVRIDGVYSPKQPDDAESVFFVEFQAQKSERTYSNLLLKIGLYLEKVNPRQNWHAVVVYPSRGVEQENLHPYRAWLQSEQMTRIYLEDLPEPGLEEIGLSILRLIVAKPDEALSTAQRLIPRLRKSKEPAERRAKLIELIVTVVVYQWPKMSREELENMLQVNDFRDTKIYQEAHGEGKAEGLEEVALQLLAEKFSLEKIAKVTGLSLAAIKQLKKKPRK